ncbi:hypothetical protein [Microvirga thermotolerans]|uniref:Uncharacterized protein n=1 Tax=Microvirga thermotolerans TaxID=2651334 RepID=A0A5P9JWN0_9HYPH|nr:hypothetical protein [Microvirga thermotolerans]QFU16046.1 hypothetical protein GDR74_07295 [Microvirga thermotolerans]
MSPADRILSRLPDPDDVLRRLADVLQLPARCRRRACRREHGCQGGYGPPCYLAHRQMFAEAVGEGLHQARVHWREQRESLRAILRR